MDRPEETDSAAWHDVRFLDTLNPRFRRDPDGLALLLDTGEEWRGVSVSRAFPLSNPDQYIGVQDAEGNDVGMISDPETLEVESRDVLREELEIRYFLPRIERVLRVREEYGSLYWTVETNHGRREIIVANPKDSLLELGPTRILMTDVDGVRYEFPDIRRLDGRTQSLLLRNL